MKACEVKTRSTASRISAAIVWCWATRSMNGTAVEPGECADGDPATAMVRLPALRRSESEERREGEEAGLYAQAPNVSTSGRGEFCIPEGTFIMRNACRETVSVFDFDHSFLVAEDGAPGVAVRRGQRRDHNHDSQTTAGFSDLRPSDSITISRPLSRSRPEKAKPSITQIFSDVSPITDALCDSQVRPPHLCGTFRHPMTSKGRIRLKLRARNSGFPAGTSGPARD